MSVNQEVRGNALKIYLYLLRHGPSELRDIQRGVGLSSASLASYHLGKLSDAGFVTQDEHGRYLAVKEASDKVLEGYARMGPAIVPQARACQTRLIMFRFLLHRWILSPILNFSENFLQLRRALPHVFSSSLPTLCKPLLLLSF